MAVEKQNKNGRLKLKQDLAKGSFETLYILYGEEAYLREYYLRQLRKKVVDETFADFNLIELDGKTLTLESLTEAVDSYPAMSERKLVIVTDFNIYAPPASFGDQLIDLLSDLPDYVCLVFYFDILEAKPDKRTKMYKLLEKKACIAEFARLEEKELIERLERRARELNCIISDEDAAYMIFLCGTSLTNLMGEIEKAAAHCTTGEIKRYNIDAVCSPVLDAVVFDLTDAIAAGKFEKAVALVGDLLRLKNNEVVIFTTIMRHIQRLYAAKICAETRGGDRYLAEMIGSKSPFYAKKIQSAARRLPLPVLRRAASLCARTDSELKGSAVDRQKLIELTLLDIAAEVKGAKS